MIKHVESRYQKWFYEEKLHKDDYTRYLHKIFDSKKDQNEAYKIIQAASSHDSLEEVVKRLVDHFRIHSQSEIFDLQEKFLAYKINVQKSDESFQSIFNLQSSILHLNDDYEESSC